MTLNEHLEALREYVHQPSSHQVWQSICRTLEEMAAEEVDLGLEYTQAHIHLVDPFLRTLRLTCNNTWLQQDRVPVWWPLLHAVEFSFYKARARDVKAMANAPLLPHIERLAFDRGSKGQFTATILRSAHLTSLKALDLKEFGHSKQRFRSVWSTAVLEALMEQPWLGRLAHLGVVSHDHGSRWVEEICSPGRFESLSSLCLKRMQLGDDDIKTLSSASLSRALAHLDLSWGSWGLEGLGALLEAPFLPQLKTLVVDGLSLGAEGARMLGNAPGLGQLQVLQARSCALEKTEAMLLAASATLGALEELDTNGFGFKTPRQRAELAGRGESEELRELRAALDHVAENQSGWRWSQAVGLIGQMEATPIEKALEEAEAMLARWPDKLRTWVLDDPVKWLSRSPHPSWPLVRSLHLDRLGGIKGARALADTERLGHIVALSIQDKRLNAKALARLLGSEHLGALQRLSLSFQQKHLGAAVEGLVMARPRGLPGDLRLDWGGTYLTRLSASDTESLFSAPLLARVSDLEVRWVDDVDGVSGLVESPHTGNLKRLTLSGNPVGDAGLALLCRFDVLPALTHLTLDRCGISLGGLETLLASPLGERLSWLGLGGAHLGDEGVRRIIESDRLSRLRGLRLNDCGIRLDGATLLAQATNLPGLETLEMASNGFGNEGVRVLASTTALSTLKRLKLGNNGAFQSVFAEAARNASFEVVY